jgi:hypothetical protein
VAHKGMTIYVLKKPRSRVSFMPPHVGMLQREALLM